MRSSALAEKPLAMSSISTNRRNCTAKMLECDRNDVHFACLYPDPEEKLIKLKVGVLDFEELFKKVV